MSIAILKSNFSSDSANDNENKHHWPEAARRFIPQLFDLVRYVNAPIVKKYHISNFNNGEADKLGNLLNKHNSDKANNPNKPRAHNYHYVYNNIFNNLGVENKLNILEVGLGTNNTSIASNMGKNGTPGASLKAFKEYLPNANLYGADVDKDILFQEERIQTTYLDQMKKETFGDLKKTFENIKYDLIIDDGLHNVCANLNTLQFGLENLNVNGWIVIEDIGKMKYANWVVIDQIVSQGTNLETFLVDGHQTFMYVVHKLK